MQFADPLCVTSCQYTTMLPEPVAQMVGSLTADQKVWGSIPTQATAK
jgi:hypothetical protein